MSNATASEPTVTPVEIVSVSKGGQKVTVRKAKVIADGALPGDHLYAGVPVGTYTVERDENAQIEQFRQRKDGSFRSIGGGYGYLTFGSVQVYRDPSL